MRLILAQSFTASINQLFQRPQLIPGRPPRWMDGTFEYSGRVLLVNACNRSGWLRLPGKRLTK